MSKCPVCANSQCTSAQALDGAVPLDCPRCGRVALSLDGHMRLTDLFAAGSIDASVLSHELRKRQRPDGKPTILDPTALELLVGNFVLPSPQEQANNLILWIGNHQVGPAGFASANFHAVAASVGVRIHSTSAEEPGFNWLCSEIKSAGLCKLRSNESNLQLQLTMQGWAEHDRLRRRTAESYTAFMAMQFGDAQMNGVLDECFKPAAVRAEEISEWGKVSPKQ